MVSGWQADTVGLDPMKVALDTVKEVFAIGF